jgi:5'-nucleotidase / UDP-sugar diphosphatase
MVTNRRHRLPWILLSAFLFLSLPTAAGARVVHFTLLFTNDHHGQVDPLVSTDPSQPVGGVARRMALIESIRKEVGPSRVILVDAGDLFSGTAFSDLTKGRVDCAAYQMMDYDAIALGNHDFDYGRDAILEYRKYFRIPWISANIVVRSNSQNFVRPYVLKYVGVRVGLIGFSNPDTPSIVGRRNVAGLIFNPPGASAKGLHSILKKDADIFIAISNLGLEADKKFAKDNPFLDVVVGGQGSASLTQPILDQKADGRPEGSILVQAGAKGLYLGRLDLTVAGKRNPQTQKEEYSVQSYRYRLIPITADLPEDPQMVALLDKYKGRLKSKPMDEVLAEVAADSNGDKGGDSLIGEVAADAVRAASQAEVALLPDGAFRSDFKAGKLTREALYQLYPFDDKVVVLDMPGALLRRALEHSLEEKGRAGFLQVSGITVEKNASGLSVKVSGEPLNDQRQYGVAMTGSLADGEGGYALFRHLASRRNAQGSIRDLLEKALQARQKIGPSDLEPRWKIP